MPWRLSCDVQAMQLLRDRLASSEADAIGRKEIYEAQISALTERLNDADATRLQKLTDKLHKLDQMGDDPDVEDVEMSEIGKAEVAARDKMISRMQIDLDRISDENRQFEQLIGEKNAEIEELTWQVV